MIQQISLGESRERLPPMSPFLSAKEKFLKEIKSASPGNQTKDFFFHKSKTAFLLSWRNQISNITSLSQSLSQLPGHNALQFHEG